MRCMGCGAAMRLDDDKEFLIYDYCGSVYCPDPNDRGIRDLGETTGLSCSLCTVPMVHAAIAGKRVSYCRQCRGILIGMDLFATLVQTLRTKNNSAVEVLQPPDWNGLQRQMNCPQCRQQMNTHLYGGPGNIIIDNCEQCSLNWLDDGELQRIIGAPDRQYETRRRG